MKCPWSYICVCLFPIVVAINCCITPLLFSFSLLSHFFVIFLPVIYKLCTSILSRKILYSYKIVPFTWHISYCCCCYCIAFWWPLTNFGWKDSSTFFATFIFFFGLTDIWIANISFRFPFVLSKDLLDF